MNQKTFLIIQQLKWELNASHLLLWNRCDFTYFICFISHILISVHVIYFLNIMIYLNVRKNVKFFTIILGQQKYKVQNGVHLVEDHLPLMCCIKLKFFNVLVIYFLVATIKKKIQQIFTKNIVFILLFLKLHLKVSSLGNQ